ncbi:MAG: YwaF family protein [Erysipelotrichaceae bacterium]|nr:YwaF family protein [Erysipelotrichaceae bacterium]
MNYGFFDYKYNIAGYDGGDFDSLLRLMYPAVSLILITVFVKQIRKNGWKGMTGFMKVLSVYLIIEEIFKISWESYWDVTTGRGFNIGGILPLDTCSIFLYVLPCAAFGKGKVRRCALAWMSSIGVLSGMSYMLFPMVLKWYPVFTYGAYHSLMFHFMMVFTGTAAVASGLIRISAEDIVYGFVPQLIMACFVIPLNYLFDWDYMLLKEASGIPFVENLADTFAERGTEYLTTMMVIFLYLMMDSLSMIFNYQLQNLPAEKSRGLTKYQH